MNTENEDLYQIYRLKDTDKSIKKAKDHRNEFCVDIHCNNTENPLINCPQCMVKLHDWKLEDHLIICLENKIPCINAVYGCPSFMSRRQIASHLPHCPANIVFCKRVWCRWPIEEKQVRCGFKNYHVRFSQLDVALAVRDDHLLRQKENSSPSCIELCSWNGATKNFSRNSNRRSSIGSDTPRQFKFDDDRCNSVWNKKKYPPGLKSSIIQNLLSTTQTVKDHAQINSSITQEEMDNSEEVKLKDIVKLDLQIEFPFAYSISSIDNILLCNKRFRRDEIHSHYEDVHNEVQSNINGWYQIRCPLAYAGCNWHTYRFAPGINSQMHYDFELDAFIPSLNNCKKNDENKQTVVDIHMHKTREGTPEIYTSCDYNSNVTANDLSTPARDRCRSSTPKEIASSNVFCQSQLLSLPIELLLIIMSYLDSSSLWRLSSTCHQLHELCEPVVKKRGIIDLTWEKDAKSCWKVTKKTWHFTTAFSKVNWISMDRPKVTEHLKICKFYKKNVREQPFKILSE
ncbi:DgyrCDS6728 [Dimorphilus gyrociliatus]|uniref:DgyrCDS6728 n=1 Tax=Dimorphilus gyrociliatus TaxID=2664684 RepID=A0A7I8VPI2_9ANNE|nr:DgyrCDS6728 [Dimorphilus gyrociliatus]